MHLKKKRSRKGGKGREGNGTASKVKRVPGKSPHPIEWGKADLRWGEGQKKGKKEAEK